MASAVESKGSDATSQAEREQVATVVRNLHQLNLLQVLSSKLWLKCQDLTESRWSVAGLRFRLRLHRHTIWTPPASTRAFTPCATQRDWRAFRRDAFGAGCAAIATVPERKLMRHRPCGRVGILRGDQRKDSTDSPHL